MAEPLLSLEGVSKGFPGVQALDDMHLHVNPGEVLALVGENGAGKSTLMKLLSGIYRPDSGTFSLGGEPYTPSGPKHAEELGIGIIHQEFHLMPDLTVAQNIYIGREPKHAGVFTDDRELNRMTSELLTRLGLDLDPRTTVGTLTVARQQMVEIAKALSNDATKVLIMDEPTAALNNAEVATLHDLIRRFVTPHTAVIYISHRMDELRAIADRITVIRDGKYIDTVITAETTMSEVISRMVGRQIDTSVGPQNVREDREIVLTVENLSTKDLLRDVSFELRKGEILGFAGLMGAGRTEVARAIVGADPIATGTIMIHGRQVRIPHPARANEYGIGYLSEDRKRYGLLLNLSVADNIALSSLREKFTTGGFVRTTSIAQAARERVQALGIRTPSVRQEVNNLSGGNQQKVVIAKWLTKDCDILIFDEPTRGIDVGAKDEIYTLLNELAAAGKSIIMISSELPEVLRMAHRVVVMSEGRITGELDHGHTTQENVMELATLRPDSTPIVTSEAGPE